MDKWITKWNKDDFINIIKKFNQYLTSKKNNNKSYNKIINQTIEKLNNMDLQINTNTYDDEWFWCTQKSILTLLFHILCCF